MLVMPVEIFRSDLKSFCSQIDDLENMPSTRSLMQKIDDYLSGKNNIRLSGYQKVGTAEPVDQVSLVKLINEIFSPALEASLTDASDAMQIIRSNGTFGWMGNPLLIIKLARKLKADKYLLDVLQKIMIKSEMEDDFLLDMIDGEKIHDTIDILYEKISYLDEDLLDLLKNHQWQLGGRHNLFMFPTLNLKKYCAEDLENISFSISKIVQTLHPMRILRVAESNKLYAAIFSLRILAKIFEIFASNTPQKQTHCRICYRHASSTGLCRRHKLTRGTNNQTAYNRAKRLASHYHERLQELVHLQDRLTCEVGCGFTHTYVENQSDIQQESNPIEHRKNVFSNIFFLPSEDVGEYVFDMMAKITASFLERISANNADYQPTVIDFWQEWYSDWIDDPLGASLLRGKVDAAEIAMDILRVRAWEEVGGFEPKSGPGRKPRIDYDQVLALHAEGKTLREIAAMVNAGSPEAIRQIIKKRKE